MSFGIFDKIFCINLERREDRKLLCKKEFEKIDKQVDFFIAVDGNEEYRKQSKIKMNHCVPIVESGAYGCLMSHLNIYKYSLKNNYNHILILEDDVVLHENILNKVKILYDNLPKDFDMCYLGINAIQPPVIINDYVARVTLGYTTHAYSIKNDCMKHVVDIYDNSYSLYNPIDVTLTNILSYSRNIYLSRECLAWQRESYSDTEMRTTNYSGMRRNF